MRAFLTIILAMLPVLCAAQDFRALARVLPEASVTADRGRSVEITLALTQSVPFRVLTHDAPRRLVVEAREVDWSGLGPAFDRSDGIEAVAAGAQVPGWSRLELTLSAPYAVETAAMRTDPETGAAEIAITLAPSSQAAFARLATADPAPRLANPPQADDTFTVVLDPGHGGVDPGAEADGLSEAELMLSFASALSEALIRTGLVEVVMTRQTDVFVSLPERISIARAAEADLFLSLHADALAEGRARGATVYTLAEEASDAASASLAEQHDRTDLLLGVDLSLADDGVAQVLMDLARHDTAPRSAAFADTIVAAFEAADIPLHPRPRLEAGFSVLRAADIPSVLLEIGYLSDPEDRARIRSAEGRLAMEAALVAAILDWRDADAVAAGLRLR